MKRSIILIFFLISVHFCETKRPWSILNFPRVTLILFPIPIPIKAWVLGILLVAYNIFGQVGQLGNTAFSVHLAGMVFAFFYFKYHWRFMWLFGGAASTAVKQTRRLKTQPPRHKCTVCGVTNLDDPEARFRYCSKCDGTLCYCSEHIGDHEHVAPEKAEETA